MLKLVDESMSVLSLNENGSWEASTSAGPFLVALPHLLVRSCLLFWLNFTSVF